MPSRCGIIRRVSVDKATLRRRIRAQRAATLAERGSDGARVEAGALQHVAAEAGLLSSHGTPGEIGPVTVAAYVASPGEPDLIDLRQAVRGAGGRVLLPIPATGGELQWALDDGSYGWSATGLRVQVPTGAVVGTGASCLREQGVTVLLAPALAVDQRGTRLGQGGGFYDRVLADLAAAPDAGITVVAVVRPEEVLPAGALPREPHDAPVTVALTAGGLVQLG